MEKGIVLLNFKSCPPPKIAKPAFIGSDYSCFVKKFSAILHFPNILNGMQFVIELT